jgi:hypothetical protein
LGEKLKLEKKRKKERNIPDINKKLKIFKNISFFCPESWAINKSSLKNG